MTSIDQASLASADARNRFDAFSFSAPRLCLTAAGRSLAYVRIGAPIELLVRPVDSPDTITLVRSNTAISSPVWSSDVNQVCYIVEWVWCVGAAGGSPRAILQNVSMPRITPDGADVFFVRVSETSHGCSDAVPPAMASESATHPFRWTLRSCRRCPPMAHR